MENKFCFLFNAEQEQFIRNHAKGLYAYELADLLNEEFGTSFTTQQVISFKKRKHIVSGMNSQFKKGHVPFNKGKKFVAGGRSAETQFKKGNKAANCKEVGSLYKRDGYWYIKIKDGCQNKNWMLYHHYIWEKENHQKVPEGHKVIFLDQNTDNLEPSNLKLVTYAEALEALARIKLTSDVEINESIVSLAKLKVAKRSKQKE